VDAHAARAAKDHRCDQGSTAPDPALVGLAGARSRHNTYMSVPLLMFMFAQHSDGFYNAAIGALGENSPLVMVFVIRGARILRAIRN
jgi:uncharacterized membrane protein